MEYYIYNINILWPAFIIALIRLGTETTSLKQKSGEIFPHSSNIVLWTRRCA